VSITALAKALSARELKHIECLDIEVSVKRLSISELQEADRLTAKFANDAPRLVHALVGKWFTDADGNSLAGTDTVEDAKDWPGLLVGQLLDAFRAVNSGAAKSDPL